MVTACSTGAHAIGDGARLIALGDADVMVAGGTESPICRLAMAGFCAARALSTAYNEEPQRASRPYDKDRDGFVMGEGAGIVVLEEYEHAKKRGAKIYAEVVGYGLSGDAYHITSPAPDGDGGFRSMSAAIKRAGIAVSDIDYINAHGTSTQIGDEIELGAVERLLGNAASKVSMSSTKSSTGHLLGAAGAIEAIFSILAIRDNVAPPTINLENPSVETAIDLVPQYGLQASYCCQRRATSFAPTYFPISFSNCALVFQGRYSLNWRTMREPAPGNAQNVVVGRGIQIDRNENVLLSESVSASADVFADLFVELRPRLPGAVLRTRG